MCGWHKMAKECRVIEINEIWRSVSKLYSLVLKHILQTNDKCLFLSCFSVFFVVIFVFCTALILHDSIVIVYIAVFLQYRYLLYVYLFVTFTRTLKLTGLQRKTVSYDGALTALQQGEKCRNSRKLRNICAPFFHDYLKLLSEFFFVLNVLRLYEFPCTQFWWQ